METARRSLYYDPGSAVFKKYGINGHRFEDITIMIVWLLIFVVFYFDIFTFLFSYHYVFYATGVGNSFSNE